MNIWLTESVAAAHVDDLLRRAGQPVRPATSGPSPLRAGRPTPRTPSTGSRHLSGVRPALGVLLVRAGTRLGGGPGGGRVATGAGTAC